MSLPSVSIVIPLHRDGPAFRRDLRAYAELEYPGEVEIVIVSDRRTDIPEVEATVLCTGRELTGPGEKRDLAFAHSRGEILAFIDDDARPHPQWLLRAMRHFHREEIGAVGGPGLTPPEDGFWERAGGAVYESLLGSGPLRYRFYPTAPRVVDDYPAYNLLVRRQALAEVGGWASTLYGGEDTKLCLALIRAGWRIVYDPQAVVYHHRRPLFREHVRQVWNVGVHRGFFVKAYPQTSRRPSYFLPTALIFGGLLAAVVALAAGWLTIPTALVGLAAAWLIGAANTVTSSQRNWPVAAVAGIGLYVAHVAYACGFVRGLLTKELRR